MSFIKRFSDFILFSNVYVAIAAVCLVQSSLVQLAQHSGLLNYSLLVFFATLFVYNLQRIFYKTQSHKHIISVRRYWLSKNATLIKVVAGVGFIGSAVLFFFNNYKIMLYLSPLLLLSLLYFVPFVKLRKRPWIKLLTLIGVWTSVTSVVPALLINYAEITYFVLHAFARFLFMAAICIPFDIRDMTIDKKENVSTLAITLGEKKAKRAAIVCVVLYTVLIVCEYGMGMINNYVLSVLLFTAIITSVLVVMSSSKRSEYFYIAGIDGTMILQGLMVVLVSCF